MQTVSTDTTNVQTLATEAAKLATLATDYDAAREAELDAEASVLDAAIDAVRPALRSMSKRIVQYSYETSGRNGCNPVSETRYFGSRGIVLVDDYERVKDETGNRGDLSGARLVLLSDSTLARVKRSGSWSCWQGEADTWEAEMSMLTPREAMDRYELDDCLAALSAAVETATKALSSDVTDRARQRAERLHAVATLARGAK